jgi:pyruvate ferredoxin oxidoreductase gamma subunit
MYRIRFHGRGGQGVKTASQILSSALFLEGFEVQDAPRYGAERRGAPIFAYVRADRAPINERGVIARPGLVVVVDETLVRFRGGRAAGRGPGYSGAHSRRGVLRVVESARQDSRRGARLARACPERGAR